MNQLHWTFVLGSLRTGGAERATLNLANALIRRGHRVSLVLLHEDGTLREQLNPAVAVHVLPVDRARRAVPSLTILLERLQPDLLVAVQNHMQWAVLRANNRLKQPVPLILNEQSSLDENLRRQGWKGWLLKRWLKGSWKRIA
ncbi:MAG TPA: glycosyltransferase, partial [Bacteroidia bacterium]|nr:glycosyltransferase [Bacteroidia bacterium]